MVKFNYINITDLSSKPQTVIITIKKGSTIKLNPGEKVILPFLLKTVEIKSLIMKEKILISEYNENLEVFTEIKKIIATETEEQIFVNDLFQEDQQPVKRKKKEEKNEFYQS